MIRAEMAVLLAKVQLGDNRNVDGLVLDYWLDTIGDLDFDTAVAALKRFRRERPGHYLEPGHLLELAGVEDQTPSINGIPIVDVTPDYLERAKARDLAAIGVTVADYDRDPQVRAQADAELDRRIIEAAQAELETL